MGLIFQVIQAFGTHRDIRAYLCNFTGNVCAFYNSEILERSGQRQGFRVNAENIGGSSAASNISFKKIS